MMIHKTVCNIVEHYDCVDSNAENKATSIFLASANKIRSPRLYSWLITDNSSYYRRYTPLQKLLDLQIARNGLCGAFWINVFVLLEAMKIECWRFVAARGTDLRSLCILLVLALAVWEIRLVPVDIFLYGDFAVGTVVALC